MNLPWLMLLTLACYVPAQWFYDRYQKPWLHPVLTGLILIVFILEISAIPYSQYEHDNNFLTLLLGPVTVALAIPMAKQLAIMKQRFWALAICLVVSSALIVITAILITFFLGGNYPLVVTLSTKSITGAIALMVSEALGGYGGLAAVVVLITGVYGVIIAKPIFKALNIHDEAAQGFALGIAAHAVGTAYAFEQSERCGSFAALGMSINGLLTAAALPLLFAWVT